jgi:hypothetical protein
MQLLSFRLAIARIRKDITFAATLAIAVLLAFSALFTLDAISSSREISLTNYVLDALPAGDQTLTASTSRLITNEKEYQALANFLESRRKGIASNSFTPLVLLHQLADVHGVGFYLGSLDQLTSHVRVLSGRAPRECGPDRCEVIQIGRTDTSPSPTSLNIVIVGKGELQDANLFSGTYSLDHSIPLFLTEGIGSLNKLANSSTLQGTNGWVANLDRSVIEKNGIDALVENTVGLENRAALLDPSLAFTWPQDSLVEASDSLVTLRGKINAISHSIEILLVFFLILLVSKKRNNHHRFRSGLSRLGTPTNNLAKEVAIEISGPPLVGAVLAFALSPFLTLALREFGILVDVAQTLTHWSAYVALLFTILFLLPGVVLFGDISWKRRLRWPLGLSATGLVFFLRLGSDNALTDWKVTLLGATSSITLAWIGISLFCHFIQKRNRTTFVLLKESQNVWQAVAAVFSFAVFLASLSLSFSVGVNEDINTAVRDEVPLDFRITTGPALTTPLDLGGIKDYEHLASRTNVYPILRVGSSVRGDGAISESVQLLGVPPKALTQLPDSTKLVAKADSTGPFVNFPAIELGSASTLVVTLKSIPKEVNLLGWFATPSGSHTSAIFGGTGTTRSLSLGKGVPKQSSLIAFELQESSDYVSRRLHAQGEGDFQVPILAGRGGITGLRTNQTVISLPKLGWEIADINYSFNGDSLYLHPQWKSSVPSVLTDPITARSAKDGLLTLSGQGNKSFVVKIGKTQRSFPTAGERFVVMNLADLQAQLAQESLGVIDPIELWISTDQRNEFEENFMASSFQSLSLQSQFKTDSNLRSDPSITGLQNGYRVAVGFAIILALIFSISALPLLLREKYGLLKFLEATGVGPKGLRTSLRHSLTGTLTIAVLLGSVTGWIGSLVFMSHTPPWNQLFAVVLSAIFLSELGSRIYLRRIFTEGFGTEVSDANKN